MKSGCALGWSYSCLRDSIFSINWVARSPAERRGQLGRVGQTFGGGGGKIQSGLYWELERESPHKRPWTSGAVLKPSWSQAPQTPGPNLPRLWHHQGAAQGLVGSSIRSGPMTGAPQAWVPLLQPSLASFCSAAPGVLVLQAAHLHLGHSGQSMQMVKLESWARPANNCCTQITVSEWGAWPKGPRQSPSASKQSCHDTKIKLLFYRRRQIWQQYHVFKLNLYISFHVCVICSNVSDNQEMLGVTLALRLFRTVPLSDMTQTGSYRAV